jgi:acetyltransferase-like isoleucine patch superfamily enzyme
MNQADAAGPSVLPPGRWTQGNPPANVRLGPNTIVTDDLAFKRFKSTHPDALIIGAHCSMDGVHFDLGEQGRAVVGDYCYFTTVVLLCELEVRIGSYVVIGWNTTISDTDFHPIAPAERIADAVACSPLGKGRPRPPIAKRPVVIQDDVWIGPNVTVLKGVTIGAGSWIEPGSVITHDIPPGSRVMGNPAQVLGRLA